MRVCISRSLSYGAACFVLSFAGGAFAADVIVESRPEGQNHAGYQEIGGKWINSQIPPEASKSAAQGATPSDKCGTRKYLFLPEGQATAPVEAAAARFSPQFPHPGRYHVYVTWPRGANAQPVTYRVKHAAGTDEKTLMQDGMGGAGGAGNANKWILLSDYDFMPGGDQYVELNIGPDCKPVAGKLAGQVYADAVRFSSEPLKDAVASVATLQPAAAPAPVETAALPPQPPSSASGGTAAAPGAPEFLWNDQIDAAMKKAAAEKRRVLVFFAAPGTDRSDCFEEKIFGNPAIRSELAWRYVPVKLDFTRDSEMATRLGVYRGGTVLLYSSRGEGQAVITECLPATEFLSRLQ